jgi:hypothetical protein
MPEQLVDDVVAPIQPPPGLVGSNMAPGTEIGPAPPSGSVMLPGSTGYDAKQRSVDAAKETVSGQLDALLAADSPYLQRAKHGATQTANARGLLNTSMAAGAGEAAAIDAAAPIAKADADVYGTASRENVAAENTSRAFGADASNRATLVGAEAYNASALQGLRGDQATVLANIEANYKQLIQASSSASQFYTAITTSLAAIMADPKTDAATKQAAVDKMTSMLQSGLTVIGGVANVDLAGLLDFSGEPGSLNYSPPPPPPPEPVQQSPWNYYPGWEITSTGGGGGTAAGGGEGANE